MKAAHPRARGSRPSPTGALLDALARPRYEILPEPGIVDEVLAYVPPPVKLTVTASPTRGLEPTLRVVEMLAARGYTAVPHLAARLIRDGEHLEETLARLGAAAIREVFVVAGDARRQAGEFGDAGGLLTAMGDFRARYDEIGISGYPESHQFISDEMTIEAMFAKEPMATYIVSQICFDADVIATWVRRVRERGTLLPIWIGVAGAVRNRRLVHMAVRIGLGESARFLRAHRGWLRAFARRGQYTPTTLLDKLAPSLADPRARIRGIHVYTFNELQRTERWRLKLIRSLDSNYGTRR